MAKIQKNFIKGRMNKSVDERLVPQGEYIDALNVRSIYDILLNTVFTR